MYEVEVKVKAAHEAVRTRLEALDADHLGAVVQTDTYYDHPSRSFADTDEALRVRREGSTERALLTYKGPRVDDASKTREEREVAVEDADSLGAVLRALGCDPVATVEKERDRYAVAGYTVALDRVDGLGEFVEVEAHGAEGEVDRVREGAFDLLRELGLDPRSQIRASYLERLLET